MKQVLVEFLEVLINQILFLRGIYPSQIFKKQKAYSLPVQISIYPPLNTYIKNVLSEVLNLLNSSQLKSFELRIIKNEEVLESYMFDINKDTFLKSANYEDLEEEFRLCIHSLENRCKVFRKCSRDCKFKIFLHTDSYHDYKDESKSLDFLWIRHDQPPSSSSSTIVPIFINSKSNSFHFYLEKLHQ